MCLQDHLDNYLKFLKIEAIFYMSFTAPLSLIQIGLATYMTLLKLVPLAKHAAEFLKGCRSQKLLT